MLGAHAVKINGQCLPYVESLYHNHHLVATVYIDPDIIAKNKIKKKFTWFICTQFINNCVYMLYLYVCMWATVRYMTTIKMDSETAYMI